MDFISVNLDIDWNIYLQLILVSLVPIGMSVVFYLLRRAPFAKKIPYAAWQAVIGIFFGAASVFGTEFGIATEGAVINVRDAAPLCAGLIFGAPAGIISGIIGGVERWFAVLWGAGAYTRLACTISTIICGFYAGALRKLLFDNKRPTWGVGMVTGVVMEVVHLSLVFVTHLDDTTQAYAVIRACTLPMIFVNSFAVAVSLLVITIISSGIHWKEHRVTGISNKIQTRLLVCVVLAFLITTTFVYVLQTSTAVSNSRTLLSENINDVETEIRESLESNLFDRCNKVRLYVESGSDKTLSELAELYNVSEINIVDGEGLITDSTDPRFIGFDMNSGEQSAEFMVLTQGTSQYSQEYGPTTYDAEIYRKYVGMSLSKEGFVQIGLDDTDFRADIDKYVRDITKNRHISTDGYMILSDSDGVIVSNAVSGKSRKLSESGLWIDSSRGEEELFRCTVYKEECICMCRYAEGYYVFAMIPEADAFAARDASAYVNSFMMVLIFAAMFILIYLLIKRHVVDNIKTVNEDLGMIIGGNLNTVVDVRGSREFASLSDDINTTVDTLKRYIDEAASRIDKELAFAKLIQHSALPSVFPNESSYEIYATMDTAKEVGGDFYDFYRLPEGRVAFLIADVSGKGIPAAMFMMTSKTMIKNLAESGLPIDEVMTQANEKLCETNEAGMFVTVWFGILDTATGHVDFVNAGHNPPLLFRNGKGYEYLRSRAGMVLAGIEGMRYRRHEVDLQPGDRIYLYTDGVTEATDTEEQLYGEDRLLTYLNAHQSDGARATLTGVKADVDAFVGEAEQFDDITMLMVEYKG